VNTTYLISPFFILLSLIPSVYDCLV
jgi:hypothetical protein